MRIHVLALSRWFMNAYICYNCITRPIYNRHDPRQIVRYQIVFFLLVEKCNTTKSFQCHDEACIPERWVCDGEVDCSQGEDEDPAFCGEHWLHLNPLPLSNWEPPYDDSGHSVLVDYILPLLKNEFKVGS